MCRLYYCIHMCMIVAISKDNVMCVWCVGRWYGLVCGEVVWFGVWGGGMV